MRLFAAIPIPANLHPAISGAASHLRERMGVRMASPGNWHLTLRFMGDVGEETAKKIERALSEVRFSPFTVRLFGAGAYPNANFPRAIHIGGESQGAGELARKVEAALLPLGLPSDGKKFSVHVTVARSKGAGDIGDFVKRTGEVGSFEARSFCLMKSTLLAHEAAYEVLREYPAEA